MSDTSIYSHFFQDRVRSRGLCMAIMPWSLLMTKALQLYHLLDLVFH